MRDILVIVDAQNDFLTLSLANEHADRVIRAICNTLTDHHYDRVFLTRDTHDENYLQTKEGHDLPVVHCVKDTIGWQINGEILEALHANYNPNDTVFMDKNTFGSQLLFKAVQLEAAVYGEENLRITFVGVCTGICVISNILLAKTAAPNANIRVIENACACVTDRSHETALNAMKTGYIDVVSIEKPENEILDEVSMALLAYASDNIDVIKENGELFVSYCSDNNSFPFSNIKYNADGLDYEYLEKGLDKLHVGHCW